MPTTYNSLLQQLALHVNALGNATTPTALNTAYDTSPLTVGNFNVSTGSSIFSFLFLKQVLLNSQEGLFLALASTATNPLRRTIETQTDALASGSQITENAAGTPVVGAYGLVRDATNNRPLTLNEVEIIDLRNNSSWMILDVYEYALVGDRIVHTRDGVIVDVCAYERPDADMLDLTTNILLPDILGPAMVHGAVAECFRDDEYMGQASQSAQTYTAWIAGLSQGMAQIEPQTNPTPDAQKKYEAA